MRIVVIHQPQYLPWLGYFDKLDQCDVFCLLDTVQYKKNEYQNRNRIKTDKGWQWLTVPVTYRFPQRICEVGIDMKDKWARKHREAIKTCYSRAPYFDQYFDTMASFLDAEWNLLADVNTACIRLASSLLGIGREIVPASRLRTHSDNSTLRLIEITKALGGDTYLAGKDGARYMDTELFAKEGIRLLFQDFEHPSYPQCFGHFEPYMSVIDLLFNCGPGSLSVLRATRREPIGLNI